MPCAQPSSAGQEVAPHRAGGAYIQALNLPILTLLRVLTCMPRRSCCPMTVLGIVANQVAELGLAWWQFLIIWSLWPITAVPHAIVEYFLIERLVLRALDSWTPRWEAIMEPIPRPRAPPCCAC